jgi:hypothetical protein
VAFVRERGELTPAPPDRVTVRNAASPAARLGTVALVGRAPLAAAGRDAADSSRTVAALLSRGRADGAGGGHQVPC